MEKNTKSKAYRSEFVAMRAKWSPNRLFQATFLSLRRLDRSLRSEWFLGIRLDSRKMDTDQFKYCKRQWTFTTVLLQNGHWSSFRYVIFLRTLLLEHVNRPHLSTWTICWSSTTSGATRFLLLLNRRQQMDSNWCGYWEWWRPSFNIRSSSLFRL